jgi:N-acetyl-anhydromuramoyl-L-alanine amidase
VKVASSASLVIDTDGWFGALRRVPSPNFDARPADSTIALIVLHNISLPPGRYGGGHIERLFTNTLDPGADPYFAGIAAMRVSAHLLIERGGAAVQFVSCLDRAWHAGVSEFEGRSRCNDFSIGIELEGTDSDPYSDLQYACLQRVVDALLARYPIRAIRGHCHIAAARKTDPGASFDWRRLCIPHAISLPASSS